jgi:flagellar basal body-associated protein FliL
MGAKNSKDDPASPSTGMTIVIVVQSLLVLALVGFLIWFAFFHKKESGDEAADAMKTIAVPLRK